MEERKKKNVSQKVMTLAPELMVLMLRELEEALET